MNERKTVTDEAVEAAAKVEWMRLTSGNVAPTGRWEDQPDDYLYWLRNNARTILEAAAPHMLAPAVALVAELIDPDDCSFDHHGGCQAHGYLSLKPGETCPQHDAKEFVRSQ